MPAETGFAASLLKNALKREFTETRFPDKIKCLMLELDPRTPPDTIENFTLGTPEFHDQIIVKLHNGKFFKDYVDIEDLWKHRVKSQSFILTSHDLEDIGPRMQADFLRRAKNNPHVLSVFCFLNDANIKKAVPLHIKENIVFHAPIIA